MEQLRAETEALCRYVAPERATTPLYVVLASEAPSLRGDAAYGAHGPTLDLVVAADLGDRWRGRGVAVLVDDVNIGRDVDSAAESYRQLEALGLGPLAADTRATWLRHRVLATAIHELSHALDEETPAPKDVPPAEFVAAEAEGFRHVLTEGHPDVKVMPAAGHEWRWIRMAAHLLHRAADYVSIEPGLVLTTGARGLSPAADYIAALGDEPQRLRHAPLADVRATTPPLAFAELWRRDFSRWFIAAARDPATLAVAMRRWPWAAISIVDGQVRA